MLFLKLTILNRGHRLNELQQMEKLIMWTSIKEVLTSSNGIAIVILLLILIFTVLGLGIILIISPNFINDIFFYFLCHQVNHNE